MEPNLPPPHMSPESGTEWKPQASPEASPRAPETTPRTGERPAPHERQPNGPADSGPPPVAVPSVPVITPAQPPATQSNASTTDDNPLTARDDDLIEKEWVDKAKKVISETRHDPYMQEQAVSRLQADYLKKRYGKDVKLAAQS